MQDLLATSILTCNCSRGAAKEYVTPEKFALWKEYGESIGLRYVASGPLVKVFI